MKKSIFMLMVGMVLTVCGACADKTSTDGSINSDASMSNPTSSSTPSLGSLNESISSEESVSTSTSVAESTNSSGTSDVVDTTNYFDVIVNNGTGGQTHVAEGTEVTVVANEPEVGKTFSGWRDVEDDLIVSNSATYTFKVTKNVELTAEYTDLLLHVIVYNGTGTGDYIYGTKITITADAPENGKAFKLFMDERGTVLSRDQEFELTVTEDIIITAIYETINYTVTVVGGTGGKDFFLYGDECVITANNIPGKIFVGWEDEQGIIVSTDNPYTFHVTRDITLTAKFEDAAVIDRPETYADVVNLVSQAALVENNLESLSFKEQTNTNMIDESKATILEMTFYKDGVVAEGTGQPYSSSYSDPYGLLHAYQLRDQKLFETVDFANYTSTSYEKATAKSLVENINNSDLEVLRSDAIQLIENFGIISKLITFLADFDDTSSLNIEDVAGGYKITLSKVLTKETSTMYGTFGLEIVVSSIDNFITSYHYSHKSYVRATQVEDSFDENSPLKPNATPRDHIFTNVEAIKSSTELVNMPKEVENEKINSYFISDFSLSGYYYQGGSTRREFTEDNPILAPGISSITWNMNNVFPSTAIESKTLYFLSSSNENVITVNSNNRGISTISEGTSDVVVATSSGISKTITFRVEKLPPASITISSADKVLVNESIELNATISPVGSVEDVIWSVNDEDLAVIVVENEKTMLKGKSSGFVTVTATSVADGNIKGTKTIFVSAGALTNEQLKNTIVGTWEIIMSSYSNTGFTFTFNENGTLTVVDTYRGASARISCIATWRLTTKIDSEEPHNGTSVTILGDDYYAIEVDIIEMTDSPAYIVNDMHLLIAKDGSSLTYHFIPNGGNTQSGALTKVN